MFLHCSLGQGSTFAFTLPATTEEAVHADGDDYEPSTDTLDELFGGDGSRTSWGTGSFRYGTGARGSLSAMLQLHSMKSSKSMQSASYLGRKKGAADGEADMKAEPWYRGVMSREQATEFLSTFPAGSFLVRKGNSGFVISVRYFKEGSGGDASTAEVTAYHFLINMEGVAEQRASTMSTGRSDWEGTLKYSVEADTKFDSISGLIQHYMKYPESFFENMADAPQITGYRLMPVAQVRVSRRGLHNSWRHLACSGCPAQSVFAPQWAGLSVYRIGFLDTPQTDIPWQTL